MRSPDNKPSYEALESLIDASRERIADLEGNERFMSREINYLYSFITWKNLSDEFTYFKENAHEESDDELPFSTLTL